MSTSTAAAAKAGATKARGRVACPPAYRSLMTVGLLGCTFGCLADADIVHAAVELVLEDAPAYRLCRAVALGLGRQAQAATEMLQNEIDHGDRPEAAKVALALARMAAGDDSWVPLLESVLASGEDPAAREVATRVVNRLMSSRP